MLISEGGARKGYFGRTGLAHKYSKEHVRPHKTQDLNALSVRANSSMTCQNRPVGQYYTIRVLSEVRGCANDEHITHVKARLRPGIVRGAIVRSVNANEGDRTTETPKD